MVRGGSTKWCVSTGPVEVRKGYRGAKIPENARPPQGPAASVPVKPTEGGKSEQQA